MTIIQFLHSLISFINNHHTAIGTGLGYVFGGISVPSVLKWHNSRQTHRNERTKNIISELKDVIHQFHYDDTLIANPDYHKRIETSLMLRTKNFTKYHIQYPNTILNNESRHILNDDIIVVIYKPAVKSLIRWCYAFKKGNINIKDFNYLIGNDYIHMIKKHKRILNKFNYKDIVICYTLFRMINKYLTKRG